MGNCKEGKCARFTACIWTLLIQVRLHPKQYASETFNATTVIGAQLSTINVRCSLSWRLQILSTS